MADTAPTCASPIFAPGGAEDDVEKNLRSEPSAQDAAQGAPISLPHPRKSFLDDVGSLSSTPDPKGAMGLEKQGFFARVRGLGWLYALSEWLWGYRVESRALVPVPEAQRVDTDYFSMGLLWFSCDCNILTFSNGALAPMFGLCLRDALLTIVGFNIVGCVPPAYLCTFGPKLGLRQMVSSRYSFGYFGVMLPSLFNVCTMMGFTILNCIVGGQTLSSVSDGRLSVAVGIAIIAAVSLLISFCGIRFIHLYERFAFIPVLIVFIIATGIGGSELQKYANAPSSSYNSSPAAVAAGVLTFGAIVTGYVLSWGSLASDFSCYMTPNASGFKMFVWAFSGFFFSTCPIQMLGAAFAFTAASPSLPTWQSAYQISPGALLETVMSERVGGFGRFLTVLLALSVTANVTPTIYSFGLSFQTLLPFLASLPRFLFAIIATAIYVPLSIVGASAFYDTLSNFTGLLAYWSALYVSVVVIEHFLFRRGDFNRYFIPAWNDWRRLPLGVAAVGACVLSCGLVVPCMTQVWYVGPIAKAIGGGGDIGFETAFFLCAPLYAVLRTVERRLWKY